MRSRFPLRRGHQRTAGHVQSCGDCASALRREQQYLERLRGAPIPRASDDLTARLLARTQELAALPPVTQQRNRAPKVLVRGFAMAVGGAVAAAGVLAAGAVAVAGDPIQGEGAPVEASLLQASAQTPADGRTLSADLIAALRLEGWVCPELQTLGFHLESARAVVLEGRPAVELKLTDGTHYAVITEAHNRDGTEAGDGVGLTGPPLHISGSSPWSATYRTMGRTFTYVSDLPAEQADDAVPILQRLSERAGNGVAAEAAAKPRAQGAEPVVQRLQRGVNRIVALFAQ